MKKYLLIVLCLALVASLVLVGIFRDEDHRRKYLSLRKWAALRKERIAGQKWWDAYRERLGETYPELTSIKRYKDLLLAEKKAEKKLKESFPKFAALAEEYPNDVEIQLGLAIIYKRARGHTSIEQYKRVLNIDPNNKTARAVWIRELCHNFIVSSNADVGQWDKHVRNFEGLDDHAVVIGPRHQVYDLFKVGEKGVTKGRTFGLRRTKAGTEFIIIRDSNFVYHRINEEFDKIKSRFDEEMLDIIAEIDNAQVNDANNALYDYLKAQVYLAVGKKEEAFEKIEMATSKKFVSFYAKELQAAQTRVFNEIGFPQKQQLHVISFPSFWSFLHMSNWNKDWADLANEYETQGNYEKAKKIHEMNIATARQLRQIHPLSPWTDYGTPDADRIEKRERQRIKELNERMASRKPSE